jgi:hypothetical protein
MFTVYCRQHGSVVLLTPSHIVDLRNTIDGIEVHWVCWCGERGCYLTGRRSSAPNIDPHCAPCEDAPDAA